MSTPKPTYVIGAGPGIGLAVAERFAHEGHAVGLLARSAATLEPLRERLDATRTEVATGDVADAQSLAAGLERLEDELGPPEVVVYNAGWIRADKPGELSPEELGATFAVNVGGAARTVSLTAPGMAERGGGTILLTGGMPAAIPSHTSLSLGKLALRELAGLLDGEHAPSGVHVATVTVGGAVEPGGEFDPGRVADVYWRLHRQTPEDWTLELLLAAGREEPVVVRRSIRADTAAAVTTS